MAEIAKMAEIARMGKIAKMPRIVTQMAEKATMTKIVSIFEGYKTSQFFQFDQKYPSLLFTAEKNVKSDTNFVSVKALR